MAARNLSFWVFIAVLLVLHLTLHVAVGLGRSAPDLLVVAVLLGARRLSGAKGALLGFLIGLLHDGVSLVAFGAATVTLTLIGFLGARSRDFFFGDSLLFLALYLFLGKWLHDIVYYLLAGAAVRGDGVVRLLVEAPIAGIYAAFVGILAVGAYRAISGER